MGNPINPLRIPDGVKATCGENVEFLTDTFFWYTKQNRAFRIKIIFMHDSVLSCDEKKPSASLVAMGKKERNSWFGPHSPLTTTSLRTFGAPSSKRSLRVEGSSHPHSSSGRLFCILQRNLSRISPKTHKVNECKSCEAALQKRLLILKWTWLVKMFLIKIAFDLNKYDLSNDIKLCCEK